ncbi:MAG TPA: helix-turn-helix domain-containing protein [Streptomyces sp.]|uniref:helix-turn-helix domain-containing protein n=1 Tax=Streptomyces sp. TaxID=1931 RepID=UPI002C140E4F|nr:helix-turn-helix domain-containing protein [Streptomyces sp.]HWU09508.1 helix-turn-helix domain-containing protein [Streptomyces sp.]
MASRGARPRSARRTGEGDGLCPEPRPSNCRTDKHSGWLRHQATGVGGCVSRSLEINRGVTSAPALVDCVLAHTRQTALHMRRRARCHMPLVDARQFMAGRKRMLRSSGRRNRSSPPGGHGPLARRCSHCVCSCWLVHATTRHVERASKVRFPPADPQASGLAHTLGCVRKVCGLALAARSEAWVRGCARTGADRCPDRGRRLCRRRTRTGHHRHVLADRTPVGHLFRAGLPRSDRITAEAHRRVPASQIRTSGPTLTA